MSAGTGGAISDLAKELKEKIPGVKIVAEDSHGSIPAEPDSLNDGSKHMSQVSVYSKSGDQMNVVIFELNLADLSNDEDQAYEKVRLCIEEVQGRNCLTDFHSLMLAMIEAHVDVKTTDGYVVRLFVIAFMKRRLDQVKTNCYAQMAQIHKIRKKMVEIMTKEAVMLELEQLSSHDAQRYQSCEFMLKNVDLRELVKKLIPEPVGKEIEKQTQDIFLLKGVLTRKGKIIKKPKYDLVKVMEAYGDVDVEMPRLENEDAVKAPKADVRAAAEDDERVASKVARR